MSAYRTSAPMPIILGEPKKRHHGPREKCAACGRLHRLEPSYEPAVKTRACRGRSWLVRLFGGCAESGLHLHQRCADCGATWTCDPLESV